MFKILIVSPFIPYPPYTGGSVRIWNLIKHISDQCEVSIVCASNRPLIINAEGLQRYCKNIYTVPIVTDRSWIQKLLLFSDNTEWPRLSRRLKMLLKGVPYEIIHGYHITFLNKLKEVLEAERFDIVQFEFLVTGQYIPSLAGLLGHSKSILIEHGVRAFEVKREQKWTGLTRKLLSIFKYLLLVRYEKLMLPYFDHVVAMSDSEKLKLMSLGLKETSITVIKSGADTMQFKYIELPQNERRMIFLGSIEYLPNRDGLIWFLDSVFPAISNKVPDAKLFVIGQKDSGVAEKYESDRVIFKGIVDNLGSEMGNGGLFIAPIRIGAGTRLKIVTAMAFGMPVISTSVGIEGVAAGEAEGVIIADSKGEMAEAVINLFQDDQRRYDLGRKGRRFIEQEYSWEKISHELLTLYKKLLR